MRNVARKNVLRLLDSSSTRNSSSTGHACSHAASEAAGRGELGEDVRAEAADRAFLDRDQHLVLAGQTIDEIGVERFGKTRIGDGGRQAIGVELLRRVDTLAKAGAKGEE